MLLLLACTAPDPAPGRPDREPDTEPTGDTDPAEDTGAGSDEAPFEDWACEAMAVGDRLDFSTGCVDGACVGMTTAEVDTVFGPGRCLPGDAVVECLWGEGEGVRAILDDLDGDGAPDEDAVVTEWNVYLPYDGSTRAGLGMSASLGCFIDTLGPPSLVTWAYASSYGEYWVFSLAWSTPQVEVMDFTDTGWVNMQSPDGYPDILTFSGY